MDLISIIRRLTHVFFLSLCVKCNLQTKSLFFISLLSLPSFAIGQCNPDLTPPILICPAEITVACEAVPSVANSFEEFVALFTEASDVCCTNAATLIDFGGNPPFAIPTVGSNDIVNASTSGANLNAGPFAFDIFDLSACPTSITEGTDMVNDISIEFEIITGFDPYGGVVLDPSGGVTHQIQQSNSGFTGAIPRGNSGANQSSTGDTHGYCITVKFTDPEICIKAEDYTVLLNSVNTAGEAWESASLVFSDQSCTPYGTATYAGYYSVPPTGVPGGSTMPIVNTNPYTVTGTGVYLAANTSTTDITNIFNPVASTNVMSDGFDPNASADAGLGACDLIGGFQFCVHLEDVAATANDGDETTTSTTFTSTLNGFNVGKITQCSSMFSPATDNCGIDETSFMFVSDVLTPDPCPVNIARTYKIADTSGNTATCTQNINVTYTNALTVTCPADVTVACPEDIIDEDPIVETECMLGFTVSFMDDLNPSDFCPNMASTSVITRTFTVVDDCGNIETCMQTISIIGTPLTVTCPDDITIDCIDDFVFGTAVPTPTCMIGDFDQTAEGPTLVSGMENCSGSIYRVVYTVTDGCSQEASCEQTVTLGIPELTLTCPEDVVGLTCGEALPTAVTQLEGSGNCTPSSTGAFSGVIGGETVEIVFSSDFSTATINYVNAGCVGTLSQIFSFKLIYSV